MAKLNEQFIRISGRIPVERAVKLGEDVVIAIKAGCVKTETLDQQDGYYDEVYTLKAFEVQFDK